MPSRNKEPEKINFKLEDVTTINNATESLFETRAEVRQTLDMSPTLVDASEEPEMKLVIKEEAPSYSQPEPVATAIQEQTETVAESAPLFAYEEKQEEEIGMRLVIKKEDPVQEDIVIKRGERVLTADEIEENRRFEEQKRALEDRAERLRRMSFNIKSTDSADEMESVPAYMRKNVQLDNQASSDRPFYSGYTVGMDNNNNSQGGINTINTFLEGNKPD
jgi:cell division protein FtsZ